MKKFLLISLLCLTALIGYFSFKQKKPSLPTIAIANYGPHSSLNDAISGLKQELLESGYKNGENIAIETADTSFDPNLIPQMLTKLKSLNPEVIVVMTTPVAQYAKNKITDVPLVFSVITDPVEAGLLKEESKAEGNITGGSDRQNIVAMLNFASSILPKAKKVGILYSTSETNDKALLKMFEKACDQLKIELVAIAVDQPRDIPILMQKFKNQVDFIYVGTSGPIQPSLPIISAEAAKMSIPIINVDEGAVKDGLVLASYGVDYIKIGRNVGKIVVRILNKEKPSEIPPVYPSKNDHRGFINKRKADELGLRIPESKNIHIVN
jgi:putative ABC transport system substrate-binding protein